MGNLFAGIIAGIAAKKAFANPTQKTVYMKRLLRYCSENKLPLTDIPSDEIKVFPTEEECLHYLSTLPDGDKYIVVKSTDETSAYAIEQMQEYGFAHVSRTGYVPVKLVDKNGNIAVKGTEIINTMGAEGVVSTVTVVFSVYFEENNIYQGIPQFDYNWKYNIVVSDYKRNSVVLPNLENETFDISMDTFNKYWFVKGADK